MRPKWWMVFGLVLLGAAQIIPKRSWRRVAYPATSVSHADPYPGALAGEGAYPSIAVHAGEREAKEDRSTFWVWLGYPAAILVAEMTVAQSAEQGIAIHLVLLATLVSHASLTASSERPLLFALSLVPIARIAGLAADSLTPMGYYWYLICFAPLLLAGVSIAKLNGLTRRQLSLQVPSPTVQLTIALLGVPVGVVGYIIVKPPPAPFQPSLAELWLPAVILIICTGFIEEFIFRGVLQSTASVMLGRIGIIYATTTFAMLRLGNGSLLDATFMFFVGLLFAWLVADSRSLLGVSVARGLATVILYLVLPFVSWQISIGDVLQPEQLQVAQPAESEHDAAPDRAQAPDFRRDSTDRPETSVQSVPEPSPAPTASPAVAEPTSTPIAAATQVPVEVEATATPSESAVVSPSSPEDGSMVLPESPPPIPATPTPRPFDTGLYVVQKGDTLFGIAVKHGATLDLLKTLNPDRHGSDVIPGQSLVVPVGFPRKWKPYTVQPGDTVEGLATARGTTVDGLMVVNGLPEGADLEAGQQILLPPPRN